MRVLVLGGAGYLGTHTIVELAKEGHTAVVADMLSNSSETALERVEAIIGQPVPFYKIDCTDGRKLDQVFKKHQIDAVMHFAGHKAVGESVEKPLMYYRNNLGIAMALAETMPKWGVRKIIFSSSCTVYGDPEELPIRETSRTGLGITNPYGWTKFMTEQIFRGLVEADPTWEITALRYFNPIGAHPSGLIGEDPHGRPANILPYISQVAMGRREKLFVFGGDFETPDGTGVRDYLHVLDLAAGHVAALKNLTTGFEAYNLGTGEGTSVLELIRTFEKASGKDIAYEIVDRRPGDIATAYADVTKAKRELDWSAKMTVEDACRDEWNWQLKNPNGYQNRLVRG